MNLEDLWPYLSGYLRLRVTGPSPERFLNLAAARGHRLWRTRRRGPALEVNVTVASFRRLRRLCRRARVRVRILDKRGLPFALDRLSRRPWALVGAVLGLTLLYLLSATVWVVRIEGARELDPELLREVVANLGLRPGMLKAFVDPEEVERGLVLAVHGVSWAAVELHGGVAVVRVVEKDPLERPEVFVPPADVVAARDGVVTSMIVLAGEPVVREGDTVREGQVLIVGRQLAVTGPTEPGAHPPGSAYTDVVARGVVKARVWYQAYAEARRHALTHEPTGRRWVRVTLAVDGREVWPLYGWWSCPHGLYERRATRFPLPLPSWRTDTDRVEIVTTIYTEVRDVRRDLGLEEAVKAAQDAAAAALEKKLPPEIRPASYHFEVVVENDILVGVLAAVEVVEDIARTKERR
ncbi:MAG: sporulation protein YqfD [Firmicutes bacterium]|nr:sporulation protein YqfD [Bacillota bacterium]